MIFGQPHQERTESTYGISLFGRYYLNPENRLKAFLRPSVGVEIGKAKQTSSNSNDRITDIWSIYARLGLGVKYDVTPRVAVLTTLGSLRYQHSESSGDTDSKTDHFFLSLSPRSFSLGTEMKF